MDTLLKRKFSLNKNGDNCFYYYLQSFKIKKYTFQKVILCKPNKNNTSQNLNLGKWRKERKIEKIFSKIGKIREYFLLFQKYIIKNLALFVL